MKIKVVEAGESFGERTDCEEIIESEASTLTEGVAIDHGMTVDELNDRITTGKWFGGRWSRRFVNEREILTFDGGGGVNEFTIVE